MTRVAADPQLTELDGYIAAPGIPKFVLGVDVPQRVCDRAGASARIQSSVQPQHVQPRHFRGH